MAGFFLGCGFGLGLFEEGFGGSADLGTVGDRTGEILAAGLGSGLFRRPGDVHRDRDLDLRVRGDRHLVEADGFDRVHQLDMATLDLDASGGGRIELGEQVGVLADPYFPKYKPMTAELAEVMRRNYDFYVRYQDVIGPRTRDATPDYLRRIQVESVSTSPSQRQDKVWPIVRESDGVTAVSLINMLGIEQIQWEKEVPDAPRALGETAVTISGVENEISHIWFATPDSEDISPQLLDYTISQEANQKAITFTIPSLSYWDLIVIEWAH